MKTYNNTIYSTTKHTQNEVFYSNSKDLYNDVKSNTIERFKYIRNLSYIFNINENCLLYNNFLIVKQANKFGNYYLIKNYIKKINHSIKYDLK